LHLRLENALLAPPVHSTTNCCPANPRPSLVQNICSDRGHYAAEQTPLFASGRGYFLLRPALTLMPCRCSLTPSWATGPLRLRDYTTSALNGAKHATLHNINSLVDSSLNFLKRLASLHTLYFLCAISSYVHRRRGLSPDNLKKLPSFCNSTCEWVFRGLWERREH